MSIIELKEFIESERECCKFVTNTIDWLTKFHVAPYFHVAYTDGGVFADEATPNAATSIIIRIIQDYDALVNDHLDGHRQQWSALLCEARNAREHLSKEDIDKVLPLKTMGILPLFSVSYLAEVLGTLDNPLNNKAYAVAIRRILFAVYCDQNAHSRGISKPDKLHPFLLYRCIKTLKKFNEHLSSSSVLEEFRKNITDEKLILNTVKARYKKDYNPEIRESLKMIYGTGDSEFARYLNNAAARSNFIDKHVLYYLENRVSHEATTQIARSTRTTGPEMDPSALAFSLGSLSEIGHKRHMHLIAQGQRIVFESCNNGLWHTAMPFISDEKGRATFVPSLEIANVLLETYRTQLKYDGNLLDCDFVLKSTDKIQKRLCEQHNSVEISGQNQNTVSIKGWSSDKAPSYNRVDSWVTAHALAFFLNRIDLIKFAKKKRILENYDWMPHDKCMPRWDDIVDPDQGLANPGEGIKDRIEKAINPGNILKRENSPMFLLYGPPGTAKTSLVHGIANKLEWDVVTLSPSNFIRDGIDRVEEYSRNIFEDLMQLDKTVVLLDEMDSLFRDRDNILETAPLHFIVPAFLPKLQRLRDYVMKRRMAVFVVTNYYESIDRAIMRSGRIDHHIPVLPYSTDGKKALMKKFIADKNQNNNLWVKNGDFTSDGIRIVNKVLNHCPPLLVYRELERLGELLKNKWPNPKDVRTTEIHFAPVITPEIYSQKRKNALKEVYQITCRIFNKKSSKELEDKQDIKDNINRYFKNARGNAKEWGDHIKKTFLSEKS